MTETNGTPNPDGASITPARTATTWFYSDGSSDTEYSDAGPSRSPLAHDEMRALLMLVDSVQTQLLWRYCDWVEEARKGGLPAEALAPKVQAACAGVQRRLMALLARHLEADPPAVVDRGEGPRPD